MAVRIQVSPRNVSRIRLFRNQHHYPFQPILALQQAIEEMHNQALKADTCFFTLTIYYAQFKSVNQLITS